MPWCCPAREHLDDDHATAAAWASRLVGIDGGGGGIGFKFCNGEQLARAGEGFARWTGPLLAEALGDVDLQYVWRFLRSHKIDLVARKSWCESNDPNFTAKAADVVGLYVAPPAKAIVLCVDEKPSIQALERAQGYLKLPNGRALTGPSHDYK